MTKDFDLLKNQLTARPFERLQVDSKIFLKRDHYNVLPDAFGAGLGGLFGPESVGKSPVAAPASA
jgi:hypothetical protein